MCIGEYQLGCQSRGGSRLGRGSSDKWMQKKNEERDKTRAREAWEVPPEKTHALDLSYWARWRVLF